MLLIEIKQGQTLVDIALQYYGDSLSVFDLAKDNDIDISEELTTGQTLIIYQDKIINKRVVEQLKNEILATKTDENI